MALGLSTGGSGGGDFNQIIKYDARAGRMFRVDRTQGANGWETDTPEITTGFQAIFDMENIEVGWALFAAGVQPQFNMVPLGQALPAQPTPDFRQAFRVMVKLGKSSGGDVREFSAQAKAVIGALDALHTAYEAGRSANPGLLPVVAMTGTTAIKSSGGGQTSTNYAPTFEIVKWVERPADLVAKSTPGATVTPITAAKPAQVAAPQMRTTSQVQEDQEEF